MQANWLFTIKHTEEVIIKIDHLSYTETFFSGKTANANEAV